MAERLFHIGQRLSLKSQLCTVRYVGEVERKQGIWLGVEWDDVSRGKHDGSFEGTRYFSCRSRSSLAASFLRSTQPWDTSRTFLQAVREKYVSDDHDSAAEIVYVSGKQAEEIGFSKFAKRQAALQGIHTLVLDHMRIRHDPKESGEIRSLCEHITNVDLGDNLFETFGEIVSLCGALPKLQNLTLDGNRITMKSDDAAFTNSLKSLSIARNLMEWSDVCKIRSKCGPDMHTMTLSSNEHAAVPATLALQSVTNIDLSSNNIESLSNLAGLETIANLTSVILKHNKMRHVGEGIVISQIAELDLSHNSIDSWRFIDQLPDTVPNLRHLRISGNPIYDTLFSAEGKPLTKEDGYMLTIARLPQLQTLNYSTITEKERLNAETYYLNQIALELSRTANSEDHKVVLKRHPRYQQLCDEYGEPQVANRATQEGVDPNSLAARLCTFTFTLKANDPPSPSDRSWTLEVPKSINIYTLLGLVGKHLDITPLRLRLIHETDEKDPLSALGSSDYDGPEWWDSDEDEDQITGDTELVAREVELVAGTRPIVTYVEAREATVRVELKDLSNPCP